MKTKRIFILFLTLIFVSGTIFFACNEERVNSVVTPVVDNNMNYLRTQTLNEVFIDLGDSDAEGKIYWKEGDTVLQSGENEYEWVFEPKDSKKFLTTTGKISVVAYEPLDNLNVSVEDWTFGDEANETVVSNNSGNGEVNFEYAVLGDEYYFKKEPTDAGSYVVKATVQTTKDYARKEAISAFCIKRKTLSEDMLGAFLNKIYTGSSQEPEVVIEGLTNEQDFVTSWAFKKEVDEEFSDLVDDFVSTGIYKAVISGKGNYTGEVEKSFQIYANTMENQKLIEAENAGQAENAENKTTAEGEKIESENISVDKKHENAGEKTSSTSESEVKKNDDKTAESEVEETKTADVEKAEETKTVEAEKAEETKTADAENNVTETVETAKNEIENAGSKVENEIKDAGSKVENEIKTAQDKAEETKTTDAEAKVLNAEIEEAEDKVEETKKDIEKVGLEATKEVKEQEKKE